MTQPTTLPACGVNLDAVSRKRNFRVATAIVLLGLSYPTYVVGVAFNVWQPLTRPRGVPGRARYVEACKSAAWFDCAVDLGRNVNVKHGTKKGDYWPLVTIEWLERTERRGMSNCGPGRFGVGRTAILV
jgi:hypothetical protein